MEKKNVLSLVFALILSVSNAMSLSCFAAEVTDTESAAPATVKTGQVRLEHPRKDWQRNNYLNLNGQWDFAFDADGIGKKQEWHKKDAISWTNPTKIQVPFCWESPLSGVESPDYKGEAWYQRKFTTDTAWQGQKVFLKFGAVDWKCKLWINGEEIGEHIGGYSAFEFDITDKLRSGAENVITLWVEDKGNFGDDEYPALIGKQGRNAPCGYTHISGIWQTVWLETRSATYLNNAKAVVDVDSSSVSYTLDITSNIAQNLTVEYDFESKLYDPDKDEDISTGSFAKGSQTVTAQQGANTLKMEPIRIDSPKLWSFNAPNLYYGTLTVKDDSGAVLDKVSTYFGMRKVEAKYFDKSLQVKYIYINNEPVYISGILDQGFWDGGLYTAPSEEALKYDILKMRECGFNLIRKHLKIEEPLQYYWCDKLGMMVWQDMPHATAMCPTHAGQETPGRQYYEECLDSTISINYNHPSIIAIMLFNETWGINYSSNEMRMTKAADGKSTKDWIETLYNKTKVLNPNILVEDMSPCNSDHVQPTDLNTYHSYPGSYTGMVNAVSNHVNNARIGSTYNHVFGNMQDGDPLLNSEYGGVGAYDGDYDVSYCFKYMTDVQRRYEKQSGFVYTELSDIEYERNGILTYDRNMKVFGYDEIAYGGDMSTNDLLQEVYIGIEDVPVRNVVPSQIVETKIMVLGWTNSMSKKAVLKWRFDGTDIYGNNISTGISGQKTVRVTPYRKLSTSIKYAAPTQACVGTLTVWIEDLAGVKIAKNFTNVIVTDETVGDKSYTLKNKDGSVVMKSSIGNERLVSSAQDTQSGTTGSFSYTYTIPSDFDLNNLNGMRILAEVSSCKNQMGTDKFKSSYASRYSQTAIGRERPSDVSISVNGIELDTVYLPDNPRDMRGTLSLNKVPESTNVSAGDFGYLVNLNVTPEKLRAIKEAMGSNKKITVTYAVKPDAENKNGLRIYNSVYGRYAVNPTLILNPPDYKIDGIIANAQSISVDSANYSIEAALEKSESYIVRNDDGGYKVEISADGTKVTLRNVKTKQIIAESDISSNNTSHTVKTTLFDEQIRIFVDNNPEPVISIYDKSGFTGNITVNAGAENVVISKESYEIEAK